jgi:hypothetical protein
MDTDDGWPKVWAEMSDEELRDRLRHYLFLAANSPVKHAKRIAQLVNAPLIADNAFGTAAAPTTPSAPPYSSRP